MILERDYPKEARKINHKLKDRMSYQYLCTTCNKVLPKMIYMQGNQPKYCLWCGQRLAYPEREEISYE